MNFLSGASLFGYFIISTFRAISSELKCIERMESPCSLNDFWSKPLAWRAHKSKQLLVKVCSLIGISLCNFAWILLMCMYLFPISFLFLTSNFMYNEVFLNVILLFNKCYSRFITCLVVKSLFISKRKFPTLWILFVSS